MAPVPEERPTDAAPSKDFSEIPILDYELSLTDRPKFLEQLRHALHVVGFMYLKNAPGFSAEDQERLFRLAHTFFEDVPLETRMKYHEDEHFHGFLPPKNTQLIQWLHYSYGHPPHDRNDESVPFIRRVIDGHNIWPDEPEVAGFQEAYERHLANCDALNRFLQRSVAEMLGLPQDSFDKYFWGPNGERLGFASVRLIHYTPYDEAAEERQKRMVRSDDGKPLSLPAHRDSTASFTLLINDDDGLEVLNHSGRWIRAPPLAGHVVVNIGMPMSILTDGYLVATLHRVDSTLAKGKRMSIPCFLSPDPTATLVPLGSFGRKELGDAVEASIAHQSNPLNLKSWNALDTGRRILYQRRINHANTFLKHWPELANEIDAELGDTVRISD
ncbi:hypothetical protein DFJ74DRAFT_686511 [Hyaloraphidium curvatum]|nr:hypothetical protein DFJ74DRAFT_686511 [Hyaloraphidium curvatum]